MKNNSVLGRELLRLQQHTEKKTSRTIVHSAMQSQYVPANVQHMAMRAGVTDWINNPAINALGGLGAVSPAQMRSDFNTLVKRTPGFYGAVNALPAGFFSTSQKSHIKSDPFSFFEEYVNSNKALLVRLVDKTRKHANWVKVVRIRNPVTRKTGTYNVKVTKNSSWLEVFGALLAVAHVYPAFLLLAVPELLVAIANETGQGWFGGLGVTGAEDAAAAAGGGITLAEVTGFVTAVGVSAGVILPALGLDGGQKEHEAAMATAAAKEAREARAAKDARDARAAKAAREERASRAAHDRAAANLQQQKQDASKSNLPMILGGVALLGAAIIIKKKRG